MTVGLQHPNFKIITTVNSVNYCLSNTKISSRPLVGIWVSRSRLFMFICKMPNPLPLPWLSPLSHSNTITLGFLTGLSVPHSLTLFHPSQCHKKYLLKQEFFNLSSVDTWGLIILCWVWVLSCPCRMFSNIYGLYSLETSNIPIPGCNNQNCLQSLPNIPLGKSRPWLKTNALKP